MVDLAQGHAAVLPLFETGFTGTKIYNLGTGKGYSVLEMIQAFSKAAGKDIPYVIDPRGPGISRPAMPTAPGPMRSWAGRRKRP